HGVPVIAAAVGGLPEALGSGTDGTRPGQLIPPGQPAAIAAAIRHWLGDEGHRHRLTGAGRPRPASPGGAGPTTQGISTALTAHGRRNPGPPGRPSGEAVPAPAIRMKEHR